jgi:hypothetical protein
VDKACAARTIGRDSGLADVAIEGQATGSVPLGQVVVGSARVLSPARTSPVTLTGRLASRESIHSAAGAS